MSTADTSLEEGTITAPQVDDAAFNNAADAYTAKGKGVEPAAVESATAAEVTQPTVAKEASPKPAPAAPKVESTWDKADPELRKEYEAAVEQMNRHKGTIAGLHRKVDELQKAQKAAGSPQTITASKAKAVLDQMAQEFPESAEFLRKYTDALVADVQEVSASKLDQVTSEVAPIIEASKKQAWDDGLTKIKAAHPDFETARKSPEFKQFIDLLPPETIDVAGKSVEGTIKLFSAFKRSQAPASDTRPAGSAQAAPAAVDPVSAARQQKLALAETLPSRPGNRGTTDVDGEALFNTLAEKHMARIRLASQPRR